MAVIAVEPASRPAAAPVVAAKVVPSATVIENVAAAS
jgi:hypothetical protein